MERWEELQRLAKLRDDGLLSPDEFEQQKSRILNGDQTGETADAGMGAPAEDIPEDGRPWIYRHPALVLIILIGVLIVGVGVSPNRNTAIGYAQGVFDGIHDAASDAGNSTDVGVPADEEPTPSTPTTKSLCEGQWVYLPDDPNNDTPFTITVQDGTLVTHGWRQQPVSHKYAALSSDPSALVNSIKFYDANGSTAMDCFRNYAVMKVTSTNALAEAANLTPDSTVYNVQRTAKSIDQIAAESGWRTDVQRQQDMQQQLKALLSPEAIAARNKAISDFNRESSAEQAAMDNQQQ
jgi:hypothetical protein